MFNHEAEMEIREAVNKTRLKRLVENDANGNSKSPFIKRVLAGVSGATGTLRAVRPSTF